MNVSEASNTRRPPVPRAARARPLELGLVAAATLVFQLGFFDRWFSVMDEGHMLEFADLIADGGMLYRDATSYPLPGAFYLLAAAFRWLEPSMLLSRWLVTLEFCALTALLYAIVRRLLPLRWALFWVLAMWVYRAWAFPHWQIYNYSTTALVAYVASGVCAVRWLEGGRLRSLAASGLWFGLGVFCKQDYGVAALLATLLLIAVAVRTSPDRPSLGRALAAFLLPAAGVGAAAGVHFWIQGQLPFVVQLTVLNHFTGMSVYEYQAFPPLLPLFQQDPALRGVVGLHNHLPALIVSSGPDWKTTLESPLYRETAVYDTLVKAFVYGPLLLVGLGAVRAFARRRALRDPERRGLELTRLLVLGWAACFAALAHIYRPQDYVHLAVLYWPFVALAFALAHELLGGRRGAARLASAGLALALLLLGAWSATLLASLRALHSEPLPTERAGVYAKPEQARMMGEIVDYVRAASAPDEPVAALPYFSIAQFLADRRGPHAASYILWPFPEYPDRDRRIIDAMEETGTSVVVYNFTQFPHFPPVPEYAPELFAYLVEHFRMDRVFADGPVGFQVAALRREEPGAAGAPLLAGAPEGGRLRVETAGGARREISGAQRRSWFRRGSWPFRPVWALRPARGGRTVLSVPVADPAAARLRTAVGVHPDLWFAFPAASVHFEIASRVGDDVRVLYERTLDPHHDVADRGWFEVDVALPPAAGAERRVELRVSTDGPAGETLLMGGFAEPRLLGEGSE